VVEGGAGNFDYGWLQSGGTIVEKGMSLEVSTPVLLFPAISLLFLSYTNRFLHLSALIRKLHSEWVERGDCLARQQIENLRLTSDSEFSG
jgi:hypothetical protein